MAFGLLSWDNSIVDLVYLQYNSKFLISIISANIGTARIIATLFCIKLNDSSKPNLIFKYCMILCSLIALIVAFLFDFKLIIPFVLFYLLEVLLLEVFSGYNYAYAYNSLPEDVALKAHSKRISAFKLTHAVGVALAGFICSKFINNSFLIISILVVMIFIISIIFASQVKNFPKQKVKERKSLFEKLNLFKYSKYFRKWLIIRFIGRFALSSLIVLISVRAIDSNLNFTTLKAVKSLLWILSATGFYMSSWFNKNGLLIKGDILLKTIIALSLLLIFISPNFIFVITLIYGALEAFNTMSHLEMLKYDNDNINSAQKDMVINLFGYVAHMLSGYILLNINSDVAIFCISIMLLISTLLELFLCKKKGR